MPNCDCCGQPSKNAVTKKVNYQKLVEVSKPQYLSILGTDNIDYNKNPCSAIASTRGGVPYVLHMPCAKYGPKDEVKVSNKVKDDDYLGKKIVVCLPCDKEKVERVDPKCPKNAITIENARAFLPGESQKRKAEPVVKDYMYRCESRELLGSKLYKYCECIKRNGLQDRCPRTPCLGRPACLEKPWPNCWPSGGCHGIDYTRSNGIQRINPALEYRRDNKNCVPPKDDLQALRVIIQECIN